MSDLVCLNCGKEMEYDWAPCPHCGWKPPQSWEEAPEEEGPPSRDALLSKTRPWIQGTAWILLAAALVLLAVWLLRS